MGQQQILLIVLSVILVGIAMALGLTLLRSHAMQTDMDTIVADLHNLGAGAYQYYIRPASIGGGSGSYEGVEDYFADTLAGMTDHDNVEYEILAEDFSIGENAYPGLSAGTGVVIHARSKLYAENQRWLIIDERGNMSLQPEDPTQ